MGTLYRLQGGLHSSLAIGASAIGIRAIGICAIGVYAIGTVIPNRYGIQCYYMTDNIH